MEALTMEAATVHVGQATGTPSSLSRIQGSPRTGRGDHLAQPLPYIARDSRCVGPSLSSAFDGARRVPSRPSGTDLGRQVGRQGNAPGDTEVPTTSE